MSEVQPQLTNRKSKKDMIFELASKGLSRKQIAKEVQAYYNYVSDVLAGRK